MAKAQKKQAAKGSKPAAKKAAKPVKKKAAPKKPAKPAKPAKKPAPKKKPAPAKKVVAKVKKAAKKVTKAAAKVVKAVKVTPKPAPKAAKPAPKPRPGVVRGSAPPPKGAPAARTTPVAPPPPAARPRAPEPEKKRGRRARPRVHSNGTPVAAWLSTEKPRPASFIPAPPRAEAPSAIAAPPASSDRLFRPEDVATHPSVRTVPVRIDVEQGAGRFYVLANPAEVALKIGEGIEWDFRYIGGADVAVDEIVIEFDKPSPFPQAVYKTRKPGGARPHRQLSGPALPASIGKRIQYTVRALNMFRTEVARTNLLWVTISA